MDPGPAPELTLPEPGAAAVARAEATWAWARGWGRRKLDELTVDPEGLSEGHRFLVLVGYVTTIGLLGAILASGFVDRSDVTFEDYRGVHHVPRSLVAIFAATSIAGWALLLTGASDAGRRVFLPLLVLCCLQMTVLGGPGDTPLILLIAAAGLLAAVRGPTELWRRYPVAELLVWLLAFIGIAVLGAATGPDLPTRLEDLYRSAELVVLLAVPFWLRLGRDAGPAAIDLGRSGARLVRRTVADRTFLLLVAAIVVAWPGLLLVVSRANVLGRDVVGVFVTTLLMAGPVALWSVARLADGRWTRRAATQALALDLSFLVLILSFGEAGLLEWLVGSLNLLPPVFVFALLAMYDVMAVGARQAEREGRLIPRSGLVPMYFGALLLVIGSLAMIVGSRLVGGADPSPPAGLTNGAFAIGLLLLGVPRYVNAVRRTPERFVRAEGELEPSAADDRPLGRPSLATGIAWFVLAGWWLAPMATFSAYLLALTGVGMRWAQRVFDGLATWLILRPMPRAAAGPAAAPGRSPLLLTRALYFVAFGWWLGLLWMMLALVFALLVVTLPIAERMIRRMAKVMTLEGVREAEIRP